MPQDKKLFGVKKSKIRNIGKGLNKTGKSLRTASKVIDTGSQAFIMSGDPRLVAIGETGKGVGFAARGAGVGLRRTGKVLKTAKKANPKNKKK